MTKIAYGIIYIIINKINNKAYIGQTIDFKSRMYSHKTNKSKDKIHNAIRKYGWDNFDKLIIDIAYNKEELDILEDFYIDKFKSVEFGYNLKTGGSRGKHSEEAIKKQIAAQTGLKRSESFRQKQSQNSSGKNNGMFGKTPWNKGKKGKECSEERKLYMSNLMKSRPLPKAFIEASIKKNESRKQSIKCIETNIVFDSILTAAKAMNLNCGALSDHIKGKRKHVKGFHFEKMKN